MTISLGSSFVNRLQLLQVLNFPPLQYVKSKFIYSNHLLMSQRYAKNVDYANNPR